MSSFAPSKNPDLLPTETDAKVEVALTAARRRDLHLWSINLLVTLVIAAGFLGLVAPNIVWNRQLLRAEGSYLPQLFFGFITLVILFNIYVMRQRDHLRRTQEQLLLQMSRRQEAEKLAIVDPLTDAFNRRYLDYVLPKELNRAKRLTASLSVLLLDLDHFKSVNTRFGHVGGDRLLRQVSDLLKQTFRGSDVVIRYGGDEFLVILPDTRLSQAQRAQERLQEQVKDWNAAKPEGEPLMALSCGLAEYREDMTIEQLLEEADQNMFAQKGTGQAH